MVNTEEHLILEELREKANREPTQEEAEKIKNNIEVLETINTSISVKDGFRFLKDLRKEANRQQSIKVAKNFEEQTRNIQNIPDIPSVSIERQLVDSFEIYEEED